MTNNKRILLTGGSGFIGRNIIESLGFKYEIFSPSKNEMNLLDEVTVRDYFSKNDFEVIIHAAAKPGHRNATDLNSILYSDLSMLMNLLNCRQINQHLIIIGSGAVYDNRNYQSKMKEEDLGNHIPVDEHGLYRYVSARLLERVANVTELRVFGIFGKYEDYSIRFISNIICKSIFDLPLTIKQNRKFDYIYINDFIKVLDHFINNSNRDKCVAYNVTSNRSYELFELAQIINKIGQKNLPIILNKPGLASEYSGDNSRLLSEVPELRLEKIEDSIRDLYNWYESNKKLINRELLLFDK